METNDFFDKVKTAEMAQKVAHRLGKPHGAFAAFAVSWIEAMSALEQEVQEELASNPDPEKK